MESGRAEEKVPLSKGHWLTPHLLGFVDALLLPAGGIDDVFVVNAEDGRVEMQSCKANGGVLPVPVPIKEFGTVLLNFMVVRLLNPALVAKGIFGRWE